MRIQFLGTAAAEGIPAVFCECDVCKRSRELGGKNIRTRSQAIIDDKILIDLPADTYMHSLRYNIPLARIKTCIITHSHSDHLYPNEIEMRTKFFTKTKNTEPLSFYSDKSSYELIEKLLIDSEAPETDVKNNLITPNVPFFAEGYKITPFRASHSPATSPVIFSIEKDSKAILYSQDTSDYPEETWEYLKESKIKFDIIVLDCTEGFSHIDYVGHMSVERCIEIREKLVSYGNADENTVFALNHFSHNGKNVIYDNFAKEVEKLGFLATYDGMILETE